MSPHPGEVWLADLGLAAKTRPVVIVSRHDADPPRAWCSMYLSPRKTGSVQMKCRCHGFPSSTATLWQTNKRIGSLAVVRLERRLGRVPNEVMTKIKMALRFALDLGTAVG